MAVDAGEAPIGTLLRQWRERRRRTQLDLAIELAYPADRFTADALHALAQGRR